MPADFLMAAIKRFDWTATGPGVEYIHSPAGASDPRRDDLAPRASRRGPVRGWIPPLLASKPLGSAQPRGFIFSPFNFPGRLRKKPPFPRDTETPSQLRISLATPSHWTMRLRKYAAFAMWQAIAVLFPKTGSSITGFRVRTESKKLCTCCGEFTSPNDGVKQPLHQIVSPPFGQITEE
jgi:hypothetical protein